MFKRGAGLAFTLALAVAAVRYSAPARPASAPVVASAYEAEQFKPPPKRKTEAAHTAPAYSGGCSAYQAVPKEHGYPFDENQGAATEVIDDFLAPAKDGVPAPATLKYAIALTPDPLHTNLSLMFDRQMVMMEQAAQDEGYTYNSSWLPWKQGEDGRRSSLTDMQHQEDLQDEREACPGVLLFRGSGTLDQSSKDEPAQEQPGKKKSLQAQSSGKPLTPADVAGQPFAAGLIVFVVGEQPTGGINHDQWQNAVTWLASHASVPRNGGNNPLRVLGPMFSGSVNSLERDLAADYATGTPTALTKTFPSAQIFSGTVRSCAQILTLDQHLQADSWRQSVQFGSFQENDDLQIFRFLSFMNRQGNEPSETAILSEDETAYARLPTGPSHAQPDLDKKAPDSCNFDYAWGNSPLHLVYPRDISALRDAYEKQSVFQASGAGNERAAHAILREETEEKADGGSATDTISQFSGNVAALTQEAYLFGVVGYLRTHHTRFLVLRCTNPLDSLFLTRFFHRAYPQARVVTVGSDLLFRREIDTTEFRGVLSLSSYPLLPRDQHWSRVDDDNWGKTLHNHLIFEDGMMEGIYLAARYLLNSTPASSSQPPTPCAAANSSNGSAPVQLAEHPQPLALDRRATPDYADPYWLHHSSERGSSLPNVPPTWLSTVGRDGYWPVAVLNEKTTPKYALEDKGESVSDHPCGHQPPPSTMVELIANPAQHYELKPDRNDQAKPDSSGSFSPKLLVEVPFSWNVFAVLACLFLGYQAFGLKEGAGRLSDGVFLVFRRVRGWPQTLLLGFSCALAVLVLLEVLGVILLTPSLEVLDQRHFQSNRSFDLVLLAIATVCIAVCLWATQPKSSTAKRQAPIQVAVFLLWLAAFGGIYAAGFCMLRDDATAIPMLLRCVYVSDGASPLLPILFLTLGFYLWTWQAMAGNILLAKGRPTLPHFNVFKDTFKRVSRQFGDRIVQVARPLSWPPAPRVAIAPAAVAIVFLGSMASTHRPYFELPLLSMEGWRFNLGFNLLLFGGLLLTCAEAARLYWTWIDLRRLLLALGRMRLRRTFAHLRAIDTNSLWSVSGNVQRTQYRIFMQQFNTAVRLLALAEESPSVPTPDLLELHLPDLEPFRNVVRFGEAFREDMNRHVERGACWHKPLEAETRNGKVKRPIRDVLTDAAAFAITDVLKPAWDREKTSLNLKDPALSDESDDEGKNAKCSLPLAEAAEIQAVEEFVCLHYIAFIQNIAARMRTMALSMVTLFVSVCFAISFYPFVPRTSIGSWMALNLLLIASAVSYVYAGMERDEILSYITDTRPGRLGAEFWVKLATFLAGPAIGLLTTQFPTISESLLSWLQPGLDALK